MNDATPGSEEGSYLRLIDSCITQLKAQGPSRTSNQSKEEEEATPGLGARGEFLLETPRGVQFRV